MGPRSFFGDVIAREEWEHIQRLLAVALRMEIRTFGPDGEELCPAAGVSEYRQLLEQSTAFREAVRMSRPVLVRLAGEQTDIRVVDSPSGRLRFSVPFFIDREHVATIAGGGVVERPLTEAEVIRYARQFGVDPRRLVNAAKKLPRASRERCQAAAELVAAFLDQVIEAVQMSRRADTRLLRLKLLAEVGRTVTDSLDLLHVLDAVIDAVMQVMGAKAAVVALLDDDGETLRVRAGRGVGEGYLQERFRLGVGLIGYVAQSGQSVNVPDMLADPRNAYVELDRVDGLRALLAAPLRDGDRILGVCAAFHGEPHSFSGGDEQILASLADYAATAVRNARLYQRLTLAYRELGVSTRRLQDLQERLFHSDKLATLGRMAGETVHEMKNTLGGIIGAASTVRDQLDNLSDEDVRELLAAIAEEGWRLRDTIDSVRSYSKPQHYGTGRHCATSAAEDAVRLLRFDRMLHAVPIEVTSDGDCWFEGDRDRVMQVLVNLLRNAAEAFEGVTDRQPQITMHVWSADDACFISIADNGVGIPPERIEKIWEPFFTTKGEAGTGLGLDNVRQIVRALRGEVTVKSTPQVGTTFTVRLPRGAAEPEPTRTAEVTR